MLEDDLEVFCSDLSASSSTKVSVLKRIVHSVAVNGFDFVALSHRFHEICEVLFSTDGKPLLTDPKIGEDILAVLKFDHKSSTSLPSVLQHTIRQAIHFLENGKPYFVLPINKLPVSVKTILRIIWKFTIHDFKVHIKDKINLGEIDLLSPFLSKRIETIPLESTNERSFQSDLPRYEIRFGKI